MIVFMEVQEHVGDTAETAVETTRMGMWKDRSLSGLMDLPVVSPSLDPVKKVDFRRLGALEPQVKVASLDPVKVQFCHPRATSEISL
jgi:hypothetical protein